MPTDGARRFSDWRAACIAGPDSAPSGNITTEPKSPSTKTGGPFGADAEAEGSFGVGAATRWHVSHACIDMARPGPDLRPLRIKTEPQKVIVDLKRIAILAIDMQNDFCTNGGWVDHLGADFTPDRAPIARWHALPPDLRAVGVPVVRVNWGDRPDLANRPPNLTHLDKSTGVGIGLEDPLPSNGAPVLEKDSRAATAVDELAPEPGDIQVDKHRISEFSDTPLESIPRNPGIKMVLFAGVKSDQCVLHTRSDANFSGYGWVMATDCCATVSPDFCAEAAVWSVKKCLEHV